MKTRTMGMVVAMLVGGATLAHADRKAPAKPVTKQAPATKQGKKAPVMSGLKAAKDHGHGTLRAPSDAEEQTLTTSGPGVPTIVRPGASGGMTAILGDDMLSDLVVERQADGSLTTSCRQKHDHAKHAAKQPVRRAPRPSTQTTNTQLEIK